MKTLQEFKDLWQKTSKAPEKFLIGALVIAAAVLVIALAASFVYDAFNGDEGSTLRIKPSGYHAK